MADIFSKENRSKIMSSIKSKDTLPELIVRKFLFINGLRYRIHRKDLPGKPDIVLPKFRTIILVHGCFWHGHTPCPIFKVPSTRTDFWRSKIEKNKTRDIETIKKLSSLGWKVHQIYECQISEKALYELLNEIKSTPNQ